MKTIFIGSLGGGKTPNDGVSVKNFHIITKLQKYCKNLKVIDSQNWKKSPSILFNILTTILLNPKAKYILSLNNTSAYRLINLITRIVPKAGVIYWVIGGTLGKWILEGKVKASPYKKLKEILVEGKQMKVELRRAGFENVSVMPNFKSIPKIDISSCKHRDGKLKLVFLSRVTPDKGSDLILEAASILNQQGYKDKYSIDFYGPIKEDYKPHFIEEINKSNNLKYHGFIDLRDLDNYKKLSKYDAMLFPTYWHGEGFPGIIIDAYVCGLPILASDWNMNKDFIINGETGVIFKPKSADEIIKVIKNCIEGKFDLKKMSLKTFETVMEYDIETVLSEENLKQHHIID
ncbi:MAG: glycosyltransferase [Muribaculaceae bacterium]|nr:glycosyltransferase [Muribaculaceae bacterium]